MRIIRELIRSLGILVWLAVVVLLVVVIGGHLINFLFPDYPLLAEWLISIDWRWVALLIFMLLSLGISLLWLGKFVLINFPWDSGRSIFISYLVTAFWLAYYFTLSFSLFSRHKIFSLVGLVVLFLFWLPNWVLFLSYFQLEDLVAWILGLDFTQLRSYSWKLMVSSPAFLFAFMKRLVFLLLAFVLIGSGLVAINRYRYQQRLKESRLALNPVVNDYQPKMVVGNTKVVVYGDKFGLKQSTQNFLWDATYQKVVPTELWTNNKIIFSIPLDWKLGQHSLYIERIMFWPEGGKIIVAKSSPLLLEVVNRQLKKGKGWPAFLDQIPHLNKEVRQLNRF